MSAAIISNTKESRIYIPLLNEGTPVLRPARGRKMAGDAYRVLATPDYDPALEEWAFPPGTVVECAWELRDGERLLVAQRRVVD